MSDELAILNESRDLLTSREESDASPGRSAHGAPEHRPGTDGDEQAATLKTWRVRQPDAQQPRMGAYLVLALAGSDELAQIFRVLHPELRKEFILRLYHDGATHSPATRDRVRQEGRLLVECRHPNLVEIVDVDVHEGRPFVVTERVGGLSLTEYARQRRPGAREAAGLVVELARAVQYIHARGIIHQYLTLSNVLIDETGRPKLMDFGLSRLRAACLIDPVGLNGSATPKPSHRHMTGPVEAVGPAIDVFGLGIILKHVLMWEAAESKPIGAPLLQRENAKEVRPFRSVTPRVPRRLERICEKAMAPDQNQRYQSAAELARALRRFRSRRWLVWTASVILAALAAQFFAGH